jgi:hypothetical protein
MTIQRRTGAWLVGTLAAAGFLALAELLPWSRPASADDEAEAADAALAGASAKKADPLAAAGAEMAYAANNFLAALAPEQHSKAVFEFKSDERYNWHFVPRERKGLPLKELTPAQRPLAHALLGSGLGQRGYVSAVTIISLEQILKEIEGGRGPARDPELYFVSIFGKPDEKGTWGWRVEGHHLALNFTVVDGRAVAGAPNFMGSNPGEVRDGPRKGLRALGAEEDMGRQLAKSLDDAQRKTAIFSAEAPKEIITGNARQAQIAEKQGLPFTQLTPRQRQQLTAMVELYANRLRREMAEQDLRRISGKGWDQVVFAWAGSTEPRQPHYYRVQGPTFLIEYDNTQNNANHVHTVWRDLENDFGDDALRKHHEQHAHP